jgi:hypothetical protein
MMPEIYDGPPLIYRKGNSRYTWSEWAREYAGQEVRFCRGVDFDVKSLSFAHSARSWADRQGFKLDMRVVDDSTVVVRFP